MNAYTVVDSLGHIKSYTGDGYYIQDGVLTIYEHTESDGSRNQLFYGGATIRKVVEYASFIYVETLKRIK